MAKEFFKDLPNTTTPLTASRLNGLLDGEEAMGNLVVDSISSKNMFNKNSYISDYYIDNSGNLVYEVGDYISLYIPVEIGNYIISGAYNNSIIRCAVYNSSKTFIRRTITTNSSSLAITIASGEAYIRISGYQNDLDTMQLEKGNTATTYSPYQELNAIIENGSNNNGSYVKFNDGTMICYIKKTITIGIGTAWGNMYYGNIGSFDFPTAFRLQPIIQANCSGANSALVINWGASSSPTTKTPNYSLIRPNQNASTSYEIDIIAIGKW